MSGVGRVFTWMGRMDRIFGCWGNGVATWFDRLTMSGWSPHDDRGLGISPSPQPSPIEGEGAFDRSLIRGVLSLVIATPYLIRGGNLVAVAMEEAGDGIAGHLSQTAQGGGAHDLCQSWRSDTSVGANSPAAMRCNAAAMRVFPRDTECFCRTTRQHYRRRAGRLRPTGKPGHQTP